MACSAAQLAANQRNSKLSTGPRTSSGKEVARRNSTKFSYTGNSIVIPTEDAEALDLRLAAYEEDLKPTNATQHELVKRFALMAIRLDRMALQEAKSVSFQMRNAASEYDDAIMAEVDHLISWIGHEPVTNNRRLKRSLLGIRRLIAHIEALRSDLMRHPSYLWTHQHCDQLHHYLGMRREVMPITRARALTEAILGKFDYIDPCEIPESEIMGKRRWAIGQMVDLLDGEIAKLKTLLENFDPSAMELDRAESAERAIFDGSKLSILRRKYEAACERAMYKALKELRELQDQDTQPEPEEELASETTEELGSIISADLEGDDAATNSDSTTEISDLAVVRTRPNLEKLARKGRRRPKTS